MPATLASHIPSPPPPCKICGGATTLLGSCDFHANAKRHYGFYTRELAPAGQLLDYFRCAACGFTFTPAMDGWSSAEFARLIYNHDYPLVDGSYNGYRGGGGANTLYLALRDQLKQLDFIDYGGGTGVMTALLRAYGARRAETYDPYAAGAAAPQGPFKVLTAYEVLEHSTDPRRTVQDWLRFVDPADCLVIFTTELVPDDIEVQRCGWWYVVPRVGHVSFMTRRALELLFAPYGMGIVHLENTTHIAFRRYPAWAGHLLAPELIPAAAR